MHDRLSETCAGEECSTSRQRHDSVSLMPNSEIDESPFLVMQSGTPFSLLNRHKILDLFSLVNEVRQQQGSDIGATKFL